MPCAQYQQLQVDFPNTLRVLENSFLPDLKMSVTDKKGHNPAGYVLYQLRRAYRHAQDVHGEVRGTLAMCDEQFAVEVEYHRGCHTHFRNVIPALGACWYNNVHERGERWRNAPLVREGSAGSIGEICNAFEAAARSRHA